MSGLMVAWVVAAGVGAETAYRAEAVAAAAELERLARPHLIVRADDTPAVLDGRRDLAARVEYLTRSVRRKLDRTGYYNTLQVLRETAQQGAGFDRDSPWVRLGWWRAGLRCVEGMNELYGPVRRATANLPGLLEPGLAEAIHFRLLVRHYLGVYLASVFGSIRRLFRFPCMTRAAVRIRMGEARPLRTRSWPAGSRSAC
ncbi:MAG: hypothetical protein K2X82_19770 [Gemmataceae bacterium]|nr:hypothetical protein [Gemmataceae bacterium]